MCIATDSSSLVSLTGWQIRRRGVPARSASAESSKPRASVSWRGIWDISVGACPISKCCMHPFDILNDLRRIYPAAVLRIRDPDEFTRNDRPALLDDAT